jgi:hypothetical protein
MAGPGDLQGALSAARFEAVASVLDAQELQVRSRGRLVRPSLAGVELRRAIDLPTYAELTAHHYNMNLISVLPIFLLLERDSLARQALDDDVYQNWPAAAHILGHLYNYDLCALGILLSYATAERRG